MQCIFSSVCLVFYTCGSVAVVGLQQVMYSSSEDTNIIEVCVAVTSPDQSFGCPICGSFGVVIETADSTASESLMHFLLCFKEI